MGGFGLSRIPLTLELVGSKGVNISIYENGDGPGPTPHGWNWGKIFKIFGIILLILLIIAAVYYFLVVRRNSGAQGGDALIQWSK